MPAYVVCLLIALAIMIAMLALMAIWHDRMQAENLVLRGNVNFLMKLSSTLNKENAALYKTMKLNYDIERRTHEQGALEKKTLGQFAERIQAACARLMALQKQTNQARVH